MLEDAGGTSHWIVGLVTAIGGILTAFFVWMQTRHKNSSEVEIAKINHSDASAKKSLQDALARLKALEIDLKEETEKRRKAESLRIEAEKKMSVEVNGRDKIILKLQEAVSATKAMLRIALIQMESQYEGANNSELMGTFKEIHAYLDKDNKY